MTSLHELSAGTFEQILQATINFMQKGKEHFEENGTSLQDMVEYRFADDMMPLHFQIVSVIHHSHGALTGVQNGEFSPPSFDIDKSYEELQQGLADALEGVKGFSADVVNGFEDNDVTFKLGERELPFEGGTFLRTFTLPNFYFHATTAYDIVRTNGVPLGKADFLGGLRMKGR